MKFSKLVDGSALEVRGNDPDVAHLTDDSRNLKPGTLFIAVRGTKSDGHQFLPALAVDPNVVAIVIEDSSTVPKDFKGAVAKVVSTREAAHRLAATFYSHPTKSLICLGVTGTNGKTTTTYFLESIFNEAGKNCGVIGTIDHHLGPYVWPTGLTTPGPIALQERFAEMRFAGAKAIAMEVSSHALHQGRADSVHFDVGIFTNLTRDHLDYHSDMENYFAAKKRLFTDLMESSLKTEKCSVINTDDAFGVKLAKVTKGRVITFGLKPADVMARVLKSDFTGVEFEVLAFGSTRKVKTHLPCLHNVYNALGSLAAGLGAGLRLETVCQGIEELSYVPGRLEPVANSKGIHVFVDYAHTNDALENVLTSLGKIREALKGGMKIITVFGCGGDRDRGKRPLMGRAVASLSDHAVVTSDNPRSEDPQDIVDGILKGIPPQILTSRVTIELDRRAAIGKAIQIARPGDVVLIAGKGHEREQIFADQRVVFHDAGVAAEFLE